MFSWLITLLVTLASLLPFSLEVPGPSPDATVEDPVLLWWELDYPVHDLAAVIDGDVLIRDQAEWDEFLAQVPPEFSELVEGYLPHYAPGRMPDFDGNVAVVTETSACGGHFEVAIFVPGELEVNFVETRPDIVCDIIRNFSVYEVPLETLGVSSADEVTLRS